MGGQRQFAFARDASPHDALPAKLRTRLPLPRAAARADGHAAGHVWAYDDPKRRNLRGHEDQLDLHCGRPEVCLVIYVCIHVVQISLSLSAGN